MAKATPVPVSSRPASHSPGMPLLASGAAIDAVLPREVLPMSLEQVRDQSGPLGEYQRHQDERQPASEHGLADPGVLIISMI